MYKVGDTCYFLVSGINVVEGVIRSCKGGLYTVRYGEGKGIRLPEKRLYHTLEDAVAAIPRKGKEPQYRSPYDYM
ncbi:hypothetical protein AALB39_28775 [Lachnospiraceae bacterium 54-53]